VVRLAILGNLLKCLDIRLFGATFAGETNLSIHGPVQITHGMNRYADGAVFSEQIMSPFRNPGDKSVDSTMSTLGTQVRLREGHYVHHFSVNPQNLADHVQRAGEGASGLSTDDIEKLKEALRSGVTFYDSASKAGTENELLLWVELKEGSKLVLPSLVELVSVGLDRKIDLTKVSALLAEPRVAEQVARIEVYYHKAGTEVLNLPAGAEELPL
jgi:CRISPR-associated protein Csh2